jgi:hypothetical protein
MLTIAAVVLAGTPCGGVASAQNADPASQETAVPLLAPGMIAPLPPNGCVWNSTVYSSGAIIIQRLEQAVYFRCAGGNWVAFTSSSAAIDAQNKAAAGTAAEPNRRR